MENFIDIDSINILKKNWPKNYFFTNRHMPTKYYLTGLKYLYRSDINDEFDSDISNNPYIHFFYSSIKSDLMKQKIRDLTGDDYRLYSIISSNAHEKSFLAPHMDTVASVKDYKNRMINCIFFVEGNDDDIEYSGGTGIYKDNNFEEKIFQPKTINNSILIYNSTSNFFHGFKTLKKNCYRKAITFQFQREIKKS